MLQQLILERLNLHSSHIKPNGEHILCSLHDVLKIARGYVQNVSMRLYGLRASGFPIEMVEPPVPDSLAVAQYSCLYWVDHLLDCDRGHTTNDLKDGGSVHQF